jgi:hypothetical protein
MALMGLRGEEQFQGNVGGGWGVVQEGVWLIVRLNVSSQLSHLLGLLLVQVVLLSDIIGGGLGGSMGLWVDRGYGLLEMSVQLGLY